MSRVLIVEDETHLVKGLRFNLEAEGHSVEVAANGESALEWLLGDSRTEDNQGKRGGGESFDAVVLDVMLPGKDGFAIAAELRAAKNFVPILMLTARGRPEDVLKGFASGADDYLPQPFELPILVPGLQRLPRRRDWSRMSATSADSASRSGGTSDYHEFPFDGRVIDFDKLELRGKATTIQLTFMEAQLLRYLVNNRGRVVSRKSILEDVWGLDENTDTRAIDNFIVRLRRYIEENPSKPEHLLTVRGVGYRFIPEPNKSEAP